MVSRWIENIAQNKQKILLSLLIIGLLITVAIETSLLITQSAVNRQIEAESEKALGKFLKRGNPIDANGGTQVTFKNVRFCWSEKICINTDALSAKVNALASGKPTNFDDIKSFMVNVHHANVLISPNTLEGMLNESVFNYPGSNLRNLRVAIEPVKSENHIVLNGNLKYLLWIPFRMDTLLSVDQKTNTLVIAVNDLKVFGFIPVTWITNFKPFNLDKLVTLPPNNHLMVKQNLMMVKPFGLFPPPRIDGKMTAISVNPTLIQLQFRGTQLPVSNLYRTDVDNYIAVQGGTAQFGKFTMSNPNIQLVDMNPGDPFRFSLINYAAYLPSSEVKLKSDGGVLLHMRDHQALPN